MITSGTVVDEIEALLQEKLRETIAHLARSFILGNIMIAWASTLLKALL